MKRKVDIFEYAGYVYSGMKKGILLTTKSGETINTMTIGWGTLGIEWGRKLFIAYVRESRFTKELLEGTGEFTVNIPYGNLNSKVIRYCGSKSGRDTDKIKDLGLTLEQPDIISVPGIKELPLTLECKVMYKQTQHPEMLPESTLELYYPADDAGNRDNHIAYYAEIVSAYLITD